MGVKLKFTGYILVALIAILAYFHLECIKERNARSSLFDQFNPEVTDCHNVPLPFRYLCILIFKVQIVYFIEDCPPSRQVSKGNYENGATF